MEAQVNVLIESAQNRLDESWRMLQLAMAQVDDTLLWKRPAPSMMTLGNQLLHMRGNMQQYIVAGFGQTADLRQRDQEFLLHQDRNKQQMMTALETTIAAAKEALSSSNALQWTRNQTIQGFQLSGAEAVMHAVEHFAYHTGQVAFWVKLNTQKDLAFYAHHDLTQTNPKNEKSC